MNRHRERIALGALSVACFCAFMSIFYVQLKIWLTLAFFMRMFGLQRIRTKLNSRQIGSRQIDSKSRYAHRRNVALAILRRGGLAIATAGLTTACSYSAQQLGSSFFGPLFFVGEPAQAQAASTDWAKVEQALIVEHNLVRQNPQRYISILKARLDSMDDEGNIPDGCGRNCTLITEEGKPAVEEAIRFLSGQTAVGPLVLSEGLAEAAKSHAKDQQSGSLGHTGSDGSSPIERTTRLGVEASSIGENITYGPAIAQEIMVNLIVDDGVADRGHRIALFDPDWSSVGAGCGPHSGYRAVCVMDYASAPRGATAADRQFSVVNNGTVDLLSLKIAGSEVLGEVLPVGASRQVSLGDSCKVDLDIEIGGNYLPAAWNGLDLCLATLTIDEQNNFRVVY